MHIETHNNEKNYGCSQCGKKFAQPGNLKIHLIRHTGIKNFACTLCDMRFYIKVCLGQIIYFSFHNYKEYTMDPLPPFLATSLPLHSSPPSISFNLPHFF